MPEQASSAAATPLVAHYIVLGEGARDNEWSDASAAPLTYSNLSAQQRFQLLRIPPSPQNAITPVVRIYPVEAQPCYVSASQAASNTSPRAPVNLPLTASASTKAPSGLASAAIDSSEPPSVLAHHDPSAPVPTAPAAPRRLSLRGSRMIARPIAQTGMPAPPSPVASAARELASQTRLAEQPENSTPPGPSYPPLSDSVPGGKQFSRTKSSNDQGRSYQPATGIVGQNVPLGAIDPRQHALANAANSRTEASPVDTRNAKISIEFGSKKSTSDQLANEAQAAALRNLLKDRKKRYAPVRTLPPLSSDPAVQALRAVQVQSPTLSPSEQGNQASVDAPQVSLEDDRAAKAAEEPKGDLPLGTTRSRSGVPITSPILEVGELAGRDGKHDAGGKNNISTAHGVALSQSKASSLGTGSANANCSETTQQNPPQAPAVSDGSDGASTTLQAKVKQEGSRVIPEKFSGGRDRRSNGAISPISTTVIEAVDKQTDQSETEGQGANFDGVGNDRSVFRSRRGNVDDVSHSNPGLRPATTLVSTRAPVAKTYENGSSNRKPEVAVHEEQKVAAQRGTSATRNFSVSRESPGMDGKRHVIKNGQSFPNAAKSPVLNSALSGLTSGASQTHLKQKSGSSVSAAQLPRGANLTAAIPGITTLPSLLRESKPQNGDNSMGSRPDLVQNVVGRSRSNSVPGTSYAESKPRSKGMRNVLMKEPFEYCIRLLVRSLCICATGKGISKERAARCRQEVRNILKSVPGGGRTVMGQKAALSDPMVQGGSANLEGDRTTGIVSMSKSSASPSCETTKSVVNSLSHKRIPSPTERAVSQASRPGTSSDQIISSTMVKTGEQLQATDTASEGKSSYRRTSSYDLKGIRFTFIQWGLSIARNNATVEDIAFGAKELVDTCNALRSSLHGSLWIRDEDLLVHVMNLNAAASTILFLVHKTDFLTEEHASKPNEQSSAVTQLEYSLNALRDILVWVRYLTDRVVQLWNRYRQSSVDTAKVKTFCEGMQRFIKSSSSEIKSDGFLSALRECKRSFPHAKSLTKSEENGRLYFDRRKNLGEEVRSILPKLGKVCVWCQKQLPKIRLENSNNLSLDEGGRPDPGAHPKRSNKELVRKRPNEKVKDIARVPATLKPNVSGIDMRQDDSDPLALRESEGQTFLRSSVHDHNIPIKRKSKDMADVSLRKGNVTSGNQNLPSIAIPRKSGQSEVPADGAIAEASSGVMGRKSVKTGAKNVFDAAAFMKAALGATSKEMRKDESRPFRGISKNASVIPSSNPKLGQTGILRSPSLPTGDLVVEGNGRPLKRRRGQNHNVSFIPQLVVGRRESSIRKEEVSSLFHDGYDLLGRDNAIQERAVRERANRLSRGSMMALFGFLRSEFVRLKNESELRGSQIPEYVNLNYTPSAMKQVSRRLQVEDSFSKHPDGKVSR